MNEKHKLTAEAVQYKLYFHTKQVQLHRIQTGESLCMNSDSAEISTSSVEQLNNKSIHATFTYSEHHYEPTHVTTRQKAFFFFKCTPRVYACKYINFSVICFSVIDQTFGKSSLLFSDIYLWQKFLIYATAALPARWLHANIT